MAKSAAKQQARAKNTAKARTIKNARTIKKSRRGDPLGRPRSAKPKASAVGAGFKPAPTKSRNKQKFHAHHFREEDFRSDGLRTYASYRDLGMSAATAGLLQAHVIRLLPPCDPAVVSKQHYHEVELQMIYVLRGWIKGEYDGEVVTLHQGAAWLQPPRIKHRVLDYSDDCELLELVVPADFKTVELEP